jgi:hypothetical protein
VKVTGEDRYSSLIIFELGALCWALVAHWGCETDILVSMIELIMTMNRIFKSFISFSHAITKKS